MNSKRFYVRSKRFVERRSSIFKAFVLVVSVFPHVYSIATLELILEH